MSQNNSSGPLPDANYFNELTSDSFNSIKRTEENQRQVENVVCPPIAKKK